MVLTAAADKSETYDEPLYAATGALMVQRGEARRCQEMVAFNSWLAGLGVTLAGADIPVEPPPYARLPRPAPLPRFVGEFFYRNHAPHDRLIFAARLPTALCGAALCWIVWSFCRRRFGVAGGLVAGSIVAFTPAFLDASQWATADVPSALLLFAAALGLARAARAGTPRADIAFGALAGLALGAKLTAGLLGPLAIVVYVARDGRRPRRLAARAGLVAVAAWATLCALYLPRPEVRPPHALGAEDVRDLCGGPGSVACRMEAAVVRWAPLPDAWLQNYLLTRRHDRFGHEVYFRGEVRRHPPPSYLPALLAFKYPPAWLLLAALGAVALARARSLTRLERIVLFAPPALMLLQGVRMSGVFSRHLVPVVPFVAVAGGALLAAPLRGARLGGALLAVAAVLPGPLAWPDFAAYFSVVGGGRAKAGHWFTEGDWGQELPALGRELRRRGIDEVALAYFGVARPAHWGIRHRSALPMAPGWYAVSRTYLHGLYVEGDPFAWLRRAEPEAVIGGSILLYRIEGEQFAGLMMEAGVHYLDQGDAAAAVRHFDRVLDQDPGHYGALYQRARALDRWGHPHAADAWRAFAAHAAGDPASLRYAEERIRALPAPPRRPIAEPVTPAEAPSDPRPPGATR